MPEGWEAVAPELLAAQEDKLNALRRAQAARLRQVPTGPLLVEHANLFDAESGAMKPGSSVLVEGNAIRAVGADGTVEVPPGTRRIDAAGRALVPGLWDMHSHPEPADGLLLLAAGVTGVRDMAAEPAKRERMKAWDTGETLGPRIAYAGIVDGPGPYQGPTPVLVDTEAEARAAVDAMADAGFILVKVYSSVKPELVPAIVDEAGKRGLRVGGHIPAGMTAERAVRAGYDEIQHMNMLFLNFMFDRVPDTRTPARLTAVADGAADLDFNDAKTKDFIALLASKRITVDPTLQLFENLIVDRAGTMATAYAPIADRLPPTVRRGLLEGGLPVTPEKEQRYRDSLRRDAAHADGAARGGSADRRRHGFARRFRADARARAVREGGHPGAGGPAHGDARRRARGRPGRSARLDRARQACRLHPGRRRSQRRSRRAQEPAPRGEGRRAARAGGDVARARHPAAPDDALGRAG